MGGEIVDDSKKSHRERHAGRKAEKKKKKQQNVEEELTSKQRNPKAFAFNSAVRAERRFRRKQDIETKKQHIPIVDRTPIELPPILIAVVGPPKVGKTTLIANLIKLFTKTTLTDMKGPVTIVTGKKRRITLIECNNDINSMIDLAKVADVVLLLCDASFGFEMEVFEFLNICQVHGMPRVMGVLTHLDMIRNAKALKNTKKTLKHRFWTEVYAGAKLFYLSGILHGEYLKNEVKNLGRFISVIKLRPLVWHSTHSYLLGDRYEDLTSQELMRMNPKCNRNISLYGYIRGVPLQKNSSVHIAGFGDLPIQDISFLPDPCPLPESIKKRALIEKEKFIYAPFSGVGGIVYDKDAVYVELGGSHSHHNRDVDDESHNLMSNLIDTKQTLDAKMEQSVLQLFTGGQKITGKDMDSYENASQENPTTNLETNKKQMSELDEELNILRTGFHEQKVEDSGRIRRKVIFEESDEELSKKIVEDDSSDDSDDSDSQVTLEYTVLNQNKDSAVHDKISNVLKQLDSQKVQRKSVNSSSSDSDDDYNDDDDEVEDFSVNEQQGADDELFDESQENANENDLALKWKENLAEKAHNAFLDRQNSAPNLMKLVYGIFSNKNLSKDSEDTKEESDEIGGLFKVVSHQQQQLKAERDNMNRVESSLFSPWSQSTRNWLLLENKNLIANCFVTGKWKESEDASELLKIDDAEDVDSDADMFGDFEDLETGEKFNADSNNKAEKRKRDSSENDDKVERQKLAEKKRKLKEKFDSEYDNTEKTYYDDLKAAAEKQAKLNSSIFENMTDDLRIEIEGYRPGIYVRLEFKDVPAEFIENFDPTYPIVIGGLNMGEENIGFVNLKLKKHRWYKKILKSNDPLIISLGWRRFQTLPLFSKLEDDLKFRYLKYTPQHIACNAHFWGPITPQGTGFLALQTCEADPDVVRNVGFRIAATGVVQELDKSTQVMKKLKLIGQPLKIYQKTAFIKGMFNSALEVAKYEGARIKTVSGIRGQIKKAVNKPEGCFRGTFEDKIQLSDIVFCRTWYKIDVPKFYNPVVTLLLPPDTRNTWKGMRTLAALKREKGIKNQADLDSLYTEINREPKVFKPLTVPSKLQRSLPYRDKPKFGVLKSEKKQSLDRVAVIQEPYEEKVTKMMKMLKTTYEHKQDQLKTQTKARLEQHRRKIEAQEVRKYNKLRQQKKNVMRQRSKSKGKKK